jgi:hypothetical protein
MVKVTCAVCLSIVSAETANYVVGVSSRVYQYACCAKCDWKDAPEVNDGLIELSVISA